MALNPFFLNGTSTEQNLIQDLINEQLKIYGIEVIYIPRKYLKTDNILREVQTSKFDDNFLIEAYINTYEGYSGAGDIMTKFGMSLKDEVTLTISKERFEEFIAPILESISNPSLIANELTTRPREGDLIYFPLGSRLFEIKFVEHEKPFYQLGKTYVYELQCELFEYEDEIMDTTVAEVDELIKNVTSTLYLMDYNDAQRAFVNANLTPGDASGFVRKINLLDDGYGYKQAPIVSISTSPVGIETANAKAFAITTSILGSNSILDILITNTGYGYTEPPLVTFISSDGGSGAIATCILSESDDYKAIQNLTILNSGTGYFSLPGIGVSESELGVTGIITSYIIDSTSGIVTFGIKDSGTKYIPNSGEPIPKINISDPEAIFNNTGIGTYQFNETIVGETSGATAIVKDWDINTKELKISIKSGEFIFGETIIGDDSGARWTLKRHDLYETDDPYAQNDVIEEAADTILDFSETNPFGDY